MRYAEEDVLGYAVILEMSGFMIFVVNLFILEMSGFMIFVVSVFILEMSGLRFLLMDTLVVDTSGSGILCVGALIGALIVATLVGRLLLVDFSDLFVDLTSAVSVFASFFIFVSSASILAFEKLGVNGDLSLATSR